MILVGLCLAAIVLVAVEGAASIKGSCHDFSVDDAGRFSALCSGGTSRTTIDLDRCLANENSFLKFRKECVFPHFAASGNTAPPRTSSCSTLLV